MTTNQTNMNTTTSTSSISSMDNTDIADSQRLPQARILNLYNQKHKIHYCLDSPYKKGIWFFVEDLYRALGVEDIFMSKQDFFSLFSHEREEGRLIVDYYYGQNIPVKIVSYNTVKRELNRNSIPARIKKLKPYNNPIQKLKEISDDIIYCLEKTNMPSDCISYRTGITSTDEYIWFYQHIATSTWWIEGDFILNKWFRNMKASEFCMKFGIRRCLSCQNKTLLHLQSLIFAFECPSKFPGEEYIDFIDYFKLHILMRDIKCMIKYHTIIP